MLAGGHPTDQGIELRASVARGHPYGLTVSLSDEV
nr:MAG TPA: hypothetical protein [Caudoviricetes sp.]